MLGKTLQNRNTHTKPNKKKSHYKTKENNFVFFFSFETKYINKFRQQEPCKNPTFSRIKEDQDVQYLTQKQPKLAIS